MSGMFNRLALTNIANCDFFTGQGIPTSWGRLYGGQAVTQSLMAAQATVDNPLLNVHSLHGYFILAGNPAIPILYEVERVRDGRSFSTRTVRAVQENRCIFQMTASFHADEEVATHIRFHAQTQLRKRTPAHSRTGALLPRSNGGCARVPHPGQVA